MQTNILKKTITCLATCAVLAACGSPEPGAELSGDFDTAYVDDYYLWFITQGDAGIIETYIEQTNPRRDQTHLSNADLAKDIVKVARCFRIDLPLFTGLIRQESLFNERAVSPTYAYGLTQFTSIARREVGDQLGRRGPDYARLTATQYFRNVIEDCVFDSGDEEWQDLWDAADELDVSEGRVLLAKPKHALVYGAILLKTLLSNAKTPIMQTTTHTSSGPLYWRAVYEYNGDPDLEIRTSYRERVFNFGRQVNRLASR